MTHELLPPTIPARFNVNRPGKFRATRSGGFARVEMVFDGKTLTLLRKDTNVYTQGQRMRP